jgi:signal transduction histidine kinase
VELQRRFVADAAHELRTPLTLLSTRAQLLARHLRRRGTTHAETGARPSDAAERDAGLVAEADAVVADAVALAGVLDDLLLAATTGGPGLDADVDLAAVVRDAVTSAVPHSEQAGIDVTMVPPSDGAPVHVTGSGAGLRRAVTALVDNALDHARSEVRVTVSGEGRTGTVVVEDDGPGIPQEALPRLFERFHSERTSGDRPGARRHYGLGLALVADIAAAHHGSVTAGARPDGRSGARFTLALPRRRPG